MVKISSLRAFCFLIFLPQFFSLFLMSVCSVLRDTSTAEKKEKLKKTTEKFISRKLSPCRGCHVFTASYSRKSNSTNHLILCILLLSFR